MKSSHLKTVIPLCAAMALTLVANAKDAGENILDAKAASKLVSDRMWQVSTTSGGYEYWSWKSDGSVCLRLSGKTGKCDDTGRWTLEGERLCYELTWFGVAYNKKSACFRITDQGKGQYKGIKDNGFSLYIFSLSK